MQPYRYHALPQGRVNIRLAKLHPGKFEDDISLTLQLATFDPQNPPKYEALSYVWGSPLSPQTITVTDEGNGEPNPAQLSITHNLSVALRHLRFAERPRTMWIDAICIDQSNDVEKGPQVAMMGEVFRLAASVIAWLGPEQDDSGLAMDRLSWLGSQVTWRWEYNRLEANKSSVDPSIADHHIVLPFNTQQLSSIYHLLCRSWFERLWIRQEICLGGHQAVVMCGPFRVSWTAFQCGLLAIYVKPKPKVEHANDLFDRLDVLAGFLMERPLGIRSHHVLPNLRALYGQTKCDDPRDRIYAVLALLNAEEKKLGIVPDYTRTHFQIYEDVVLRYIHRFGLNILRQCVFRTDYGGRSWVPDWSEDSGTLLRPLSMASSQLASWYRATEPGVLRVVGVSASIVADVRPVPASKGLGAETCIRSLHPILCGTDIDGPYPGGGTVGDAYIRTLVEDNLAELYSPISKTMPSIRNGLTILRILVSTVDTPDRRDAIRKTASDMYWHAAKQTTSAKALFRGTNGYLGLCPASTQPGDEICVLMGCLTPMVLRRSSNDSYLTIGACFMPGATLGEPLLGPLPSHIKARRVRLEGRSHYMWGFLDECTGSISMEDPRLDSLPVDLSGFRRQLEDDPCGLCLPVDPEDLQSQGANIQYFDLI